MGRTKGWCIPGHRSLHDVSGATGPHCEKCRALVKALDDVANRLVPANSRLTRLARAGKRDEFGTSLLELRRLRSGYEKARDNLARHRTEHAKPKT
jgi:hypothetical protein